MGRGRRANQDNTLGEIFGGGGLFISLFTDMYQRKWPYIKNVRIFFGILDPLALYAKFMDLLKYT